jgi:DNA repair protein RecO (recombination protein O)
MHWSDEGIVLRAMPHGETAAVAELFTRLHGRHLGLVHGGRSRRLRPHLQTGTHVLATWRGRLSEHLGMFTIEPKRGFGGENLEDRLALAGLESLGSLLRLLPERDPHPSLFEVSLFVLGYLSEVDVWPALYARWELALLDELGFGLDLSACAATGAKSDLAYVSPKSGRAVSAAAGAPYAEKLLRLPPFLTKGGANTPTLADVTDALALTGHFVESRVLAIRGESLPQPRLRLVTSLASRARIAPTAGSQRL